VDGTRSFPRGAQSLTAVICQRPVHRESSAKSVRFRCPLLERLIRPHDVVAYGAEEHLVPRRLASGQAGPTTLSARATSSLPAPLMCRSSGERWSRYGKVIVTTATADRLVADDSDADGWHAASDSSRPARFLLCLSGRARWLTSGEVTYRMPGANGREHPSIESGEWPERASATSVSIERPESSRGR